MTGLTLASSQRLLALRRHREQGGWEGARHGGSLPCIILIQGRNTPSFSKWREGPLHATNALTSQPCYTTPEPSACGRQPVLSTVPPGDHHPQCGALQHHVVHDTPLQNASANRTAAPEE